MGLRDTLEKGKAYPLGAERTWNGKVYHKTVKGWRPKPKHAQPKKESISEQENVAVKEVGSSKINEHLQVISQEVRDYDKYLDDVIGFAEHHNMRRNLREAEARFNDIARKVDSRLGEEYDIKFDFSAEKSREYPSYDFSVNFSKYELKDKFPDEHNKTSAGLASSQTNNFAAGKAGEILREAGLFPSKHYGSMGYSYGGSYVGFNVITGDGDRVQITKA